jgi:uncharacterized protein (TIGR00251 family)
MVDEQLPSTINHQPFNLVSLALTGSRDGVLISVRVKTRARANGIEGARDGVLIIAVKAPPVEGAANAAVLEVLAKALRCAKSTLSIARGTKSRDKIVCVTQLGEDEVRARLAPMQSDAS